MVQARTSLWFMVFIGFAVNYMIRINLNITIVDMIKHKRSSSIHNSINLIEKECRNDHISLSKPMKKLNKTKIEALDDIFSTDQIDLNNNDSKNDDNDRISKRKRNSDGNNRQQIAYYDAIESNLNDKQISEEILNENSINRIASNHNLTTNNGIMYNKSGYEKSLKHTIENVARVRSSSPEKIILDGLNIYYDHDGFEWSEFEQGLVLGSFFWLHWLTQIPGGILAKKYGTKLIFGISNAIGCWMCFLLPIISYIDYRLLILLRVIQGLICGLAWPAMHHMTAQWIPPNERSKFVSAYLGSSIGIAVFYPLFGYIMSWTSWEWVYYLCGTFGTFWYIGWLFMVFDTPAQHPRISDEERKYIEKSLGITTDTEKNNFNSKRNKIPWKRILTSRPVWMNVIAQWGGIWGLFTLMTQAPTYFKIIHGWNIQMTGILSGIPHLMRMIFAYFFSILGDYLLRTEKMSRTNVRKMATSMCCIVKGIFVLALAYSGCNSTAAIIFLTLATAVHGAVSTGPLASIVDIAPNYAGIILGISGMIGVLPGFISPVIVGLLTYQNQTVTSWKYVFLIASAMLIVSGILYVIACNSETQSWNDINENCYSSDNNEKEMQLLPKNKIDRDSVQSNEMQENCDSQHQKSALLT